MQLPFLPTGQMIPLGQALLNQQRDLLLQSPLTAPWLPEVETAQAELERIYLQFSAEELQTSSKEAAKEGDVQHDHRVRALFQATEAAIHHYTAEGNTELASLLTRAREVVLPEGAAQVKKAWLQEAGEGPTRAASLDAVLRSALEGVPSFGTSLMGLVDAYVEACRVLGRLLHRRSLTTAAEDASPSLGPARAAWISSFSFLFDLVERSKLSPLQKGEILTPFIQAVDAQAQRLSDRKANTAAASEVG